MNSLVEEYRLRNPNDRSSADYITWKLGSKLKEKGMGLDEFPEDFKADFLRISRAMRPGIGEEFKRGFARGVDTLQGTLYGVAALGGDLIGDNVVGNAIKDFGVEGYLRNMNEAQENAPSISTYKDVESVGDAGRFMVGLAGETLPSMLESVASGLIGAAVGSATATPGAGTVGGAVVGFGSKSAIRGFIKGQIRRQLGKEMTEELAEEIVTESMKAAGKREIFPKLAENLVKRGVAQEVADEVAKSAAKRAMAASMSARMVIADSMLQNTGATYGDLSQQEVDRFDRITNSLIGGSLAGALDAALPTVIMNRMFGSRDAAKTMMDGIQERLFGKPGTLVNFATSSLRDIGVEGTTEALQELIQEAAVQRALHDGDVNAALDAIDWNEMRERMINAGLAGMAGGGIMGVPSSGITTIQNRQKIQKPIEDPEKAIDETRASLEKNFPKPPEPEPEPEEPLPKEPIVGTTTSTVVPTDRAEVANQLRAKAEQSDAVEDKKARLDRAVEEHQQLAEMLGLDVDADETVELTNAELLAKLTPEQRRQFLAQRVQRNFDLNNEPELTPDEEEIIQQELADELEASKAVKLEKPTKKSKKTDIVEYYREQGYLAGKVAYEKNRRNWDDPARVRRGVLKVMDKQGAPAAAAYEEGYNRAISEIEGKPVEPPNLDAFPYEDERPPILPDREEPQPVQTGPLPRPGAPVSQPAAQPATPPAAQAVVPAQPQPAVKLNQVSLLDRDVKRVDYDDELSPLENLEQLVAGGRSQSEKDVVSKHDPRYYLDAIGVERQVSMGEARAILKKAAEENRQPNGQEAYLVEQARLSQLAQEFAGKNRLQLPYARKALGKVIADEARITEIINRLERLRKRRKDDKKNTRATLTLKDPAGRVFSLGLHKNNKKFWVVDPQDGEATVEFAKITDEGLERSANFDGWQILGGLTMDQSSTEHRFGYQNEELYYTATPYSSGANTTQAQKRSGVGVGRTVNVGNAVANLAAEENKGAANSDVTADGEMRPKPQVQSKAAPAKLFDETQLEMRTSEDIQSLADLNFNQAADRLHVRLEADFDPEGDTVEDIAGFYFYENPEDYDAIYVKLFNSGLIDRNLKGKEQHDAVIRAVENAWPTDSAGQFKAALSQVQGVGSTPENDTQNGDTVQETPGPGIPRNSEGLKPKKSGEQFIKLPEHPLETLPPGAKPLAGQNKDSDEVGKPLMEHPGSVEALARAEAMIEEANKPEHISHADKLTEQIATTFEGVSDQAILLINRLFAYLQEASPAFQEMQLVISREPTDFLKSKGFRASHAAGFDGFNNVMWISPDIESSSELVFDIYHESGHFASRFLIEPMELVEAWNNLTLPQREKIFIKYHGRKPTAQERSDLNNLGTETAQEIAEEWIAMTFNTIAWKAMENPETTIKELKAQGVPDSIIVRLMDFARQLLEQFHMWLTHDGVSDPVIEDRFRGIFESAALSPDPAEDTTTIQVPIQAPKTKPVIDTAFADELKALIGLAKDVQGDNQPVLSADGTETTVGEQRQIQVPEVKAKQWRRGKEGYEALLEDGKWYSVNGGPQTGITEIRYEIREPEAPKIEERWERSEHQTINKKFLASLPQPVADFIQDWAKQRRRREIMVNPGNSFRIDEDAHVTLFNIKTGKQQTERAAGEWAGMTKLRPGDPLTLPPDVVAIQTEIFQGRHYLSLYNAPTDVQTSGWVVRASKSPLSQRIDTSPTFRYEVRNDTEQGGIEEDGRDSRANASLAIERLRRGFIRSGVRSEGNSKRAETALYLWAARAGLVIDSESLRSFQRIDDGAEHDVYLDPRTRRAVKVTHIFPGHKGWFGSVHHNALSYLENLKAVNALFDDDIRLEGIIVEGTNVQIVTSQPWIHGRTMDDTQADRDKVADYMISLGFRRSETGEWVNEDWKIFDTHPSNFIEKADGSIGPIDIQVQPVKGDQALYDSDGKFVFKRPKSPTFERLILNGTSDLNGYKDKGLYYNHAHAAWTQMDAVANNIWKSVLRTLAEAGVEPGYKPNKFAKWFGDPSRMLDFIKTRAEENKFELDQTPYKAIQDRRTKRTIAFITSVEIQQVRDRLQKERDKVANLIQKRKAELRNLELRQKEGRADEKDNRSVGQRRFHLKRNEQRLRLLDEALKALYGEAAKYSADLEATHLYNIGRGTHIADPMDAYDENPGSVEFTWTNGELVLGKKEADILRRQHDWLKNPNNKGRDPFLWNLIMTQYVELGKMAQQKGAHASQRILFGWFRPIAQRLKDLAHPAATDASRSTFLFQSLIDSNTNEGQRLGQRSDQLRMEAIRALGLHKEYQWWDRFVTLFASPMKRYREQFGVNYDGMIEHLLADPDKAHYLVREDGSLNAEAISALKKYVQAEQESSTFFRGVTETYGSVTDSRIKMPDPTNPNFNPDDPWNPATLRSIERPPLDLGEGTFMLQPDIDYMETFVTRMVERNEDGEVTSTVLSKIKSEDIRNGTMDYPKAIQALNEALGDPEIRDRFLGRMVYTEKNPLFVDANDDPLDPAQIQLAWEESGENVGEFFRMITSGNARALANNVAEMTQMLSEAISMVDEHSLKVKQIRPTNQIAPHIGIDARIRDRMPTGWVRYREFGATANRHLLGSLAFQIAFGKDGAIWNDRITAVKDYYLDAHAEFRRVAKMKNIARLTGRERNAAMLEAVNEKYRPLMEAAFSGKIAPWVKRRTTDPLVFTEERLKEISKIDSQFKGTFMSELGPIKEASAFLEFVHLLAQGALNGPRSAFVQFNSIYFPVLFYGRNWTTITQIGNSFKGTVQTIFGSFLSSFGVEHQYSAETMRGYERMIRIFGETPDKGIKVRDHARQLLSDMGPNGAMANQPIRRGLRTATGLLRRGISNVAGRAYFPSFNPLAPFRTAITGIRDGAILSTWKSFDAMANKAIEYVRQHQHLPETDPRSPLHPKFHFTPEMLGYRDSMFGFNQASHAFKAMTKFLGDEVGTSLEEVAMSAVREGRMEPFTDMQYGQIAQIALGYITSESTHFGTRPAWMKDNYLGRVMSPLLGWTMQQPNNFAKMFKDPETHRVTYQTIGNGMITFAVMALPFTLAFSLFMDWFDEGILGKKSSMRKLTPQAGVADNLLAMSERFSRWGPMGLPAEAANLLFNIGGSGGDVRDLSLDQRVLFANSLRGVLGSVGNWINQGQVVPNYASVVRPMMMSLGLNGPLQVTQMLSNMAGLDTIETRVNRRTNANNWLRSSGRIVGVEVRGYGSGYTSTPATPHITNMTLAAMANDREAFRKAYRKAVFAAKDMGKEDPIDYVRQAFSTRHPLKSVFKTPPTQQEFRMILESMKSIVPGSDGDQDVKDAVRLFNAYGSALGINPYYGKESTGSPSVPTIKLPRMGSQRISPFSVSSGSTVNPFMP